LRLAGNDRAGFEGAGVAAGISVAKTRSQSSKTMGVFSILFSQLGFIRQIWSVQTLLRHQTDLASIHKAYFNCMQKMEHEIYTRPNNKPFFGY
jgi:hypothetical protein